jgi:secreted PhoX family phosphatase
MTRIDSVRIVDPKTVRSITSIVSTLTTKKVKGEFDGICYIKTDNDEYIFLNHELPDSEVSRIKYHKSKCEEIVVWRRGLHEVCSMFHTPWNTVLTNEECAGGYVVELDPLDRLFCKKHPSLGNLCHEKTIYVPVDKTRQYDFYTTSDQKYEGKPNDGGGVFKYKPNVYGDLSNGRLYAFCSNDEPGDRTIKGKWILVKDTENASSFKGRVKFIKVEGITYNTFDKHLYFCVTTNTKKGLGYIYRLNPETCVATKFLDCDCLGGALINPDNIASDHDGNLYICEGKHAPKTCEDRLVRVNIKTKEITTVVQGNDFDGEMTGVTISPDGKKLWCNWKNGTKNGVVYSELFEIKLR